MVGSNTRTDKFDDFVYIGSNKWNDTRTWPVYESAPSSYQLWSTSRKEWQDESYRVRHGVYLLRYWPTFNSDGNFGLYHNFQKRVALLATNSVLPWDPDSKGNGINVSNDLLDACMVKFAYNPYPIPPHGHTDGSFSRLVQIIKRGSVVMIQALNFDDLKQYPISFESPEMEKLVYSMFGGLPGSDENKNGEN